MLRAAFEARLGNEGLNLKTWASICGTRETAAALSGTLRGRYVNEYGFATVTGKAIAWLAEQLDGQPVTEAGAGNGYLAHELRSRGMAVRATEPTPPSEEDNKWFGTVREWTELERMDGVEAARTAGESALLWSWAPPDESCRRSLEAYEGSTIILIGDPSATGWEEAWDTLNSGWEERGNMPLPSFPGTWDRMAVYRRTERDLHNPVEHDTSNLGLWN